MKQYYTVFHQPIIPGFAGQWSDNKYLTAQEAEIEAQALTDENPLIVAEIVFVDEEADKSTIIKRISRISF